MRATTITNHDWRHRFASRKRQATSAGSPLLTTGSAGFDPAPRHRCAITLVEVLISMGILTIGLLSVAALFPVGGYYMRQGEVQDRAAAIAQAAFADVVARGMLKAESWQMWEPALSDQVTQQRQEPTAIDIVRKPALDAIQKISFTRPVTDSIRIMVKAQKRDQIARTIGSTFVLDPLGAASVSGTSNPNRALVLASSFPVSANPGRAPEWKHWGNTWPVRRITTTAGLTSGILPSTLAESLLSSHDDLVTESPGASNASGIQQWESAASGPLKRSWKGDYSWIVMICPSNPEARDGIGLDPSAHKYHVSVVVFHKRVVATSTPKDDGTDNLDTLLQNERVALGRVLSTSSGGGEILLEQLPLTSSLLKKNNLRENDTYFDDVKPGQWLMVSGPHPSSRPDRPMFFSRWYRIVAVEGKHTQLTADGSVKQSPSSSDPENCLVTLRGPAWPWANNTPLSQDLRVGIFSSAVAVHSRTMRLEGGQSNEL
jgi:hypothetical protein